MARLICEVARDIKKAWVKVSPCAVPYLQAMYSLTNVNDMYGFDNARDIVNYFLCNASTFRGEQARELKAELKELIK